jgi:hypothetical protein
MPLKQKDDGKGNWPAAVTVDQSKEKNGRLFSSEPSLIQAGHKVNVEGFSMSESLQRSPFLPLQPGQESLKMDHQALQLALKMYAVQIALQRTARELAEPSHLRERSQDAEIRRKTDELRKRGLAALFRWAKKDDQSGGGEA